MTISSGSISFKNSKDWKLIVSAQRSAKVGIRGSYQPLSAFNLGVSLEAGYIAVIVTSQSSKSNWDFAGNILQIYSFASEDDNSTIEKAEIFLANLSLNRLKAINTSSISTEEFQLRYEPPNWFKDFTIRVFEYTGEVVYNTAPSGQNCKQEVVNLKNEISDIFDALNVCLKQETLATEIAEINARLNVISRHLDLIQDDGDTEPEKNNTKFWLIN